MHRTNTDVFLSASWAVFEEGFDYGWGADGDHVKTEYEVDYAVKVGCSMITLDCTEVINNEAVNLSDEELDKRFNELDEDQRSTLMILTWTRRLRLANLRFTLPSMTWKNPS